jgi:two-component system response regulator PilR (NtrC family)
MQKGILIADDESTMRETLAELFRDQGFKVFTAADGLQAVQHLTDADIDIAVVDIRMPALDGLQVLAKARQVSPETRIIMITAFGTVEDAVDAIRHGASDYVTKPLVFDDMLIKVKRLLDMRRLAAENKFLLSELEDNYGVHSIVGTSAALSKVLAVVQKLVQTRTTALIVGESGTGKELIARAIHYNGITKEGRFVAINCAALPETLVESELFGHKRGAFTGAARDKPGLFEVADGGTIFLDEVSGMSLVIQAKLLRAIEEKRVLPVGSSESVPANARILCATNRDLRQEVEAGRFREDLYYRLNVVEITLPPLRERAEDIPLLVDHFVQIYCRELNKYCPGVSPAAMSALRAYAWPGNVRELENVIERAIIFADERPLEPRDLAFVTESPLVPDNPDDLRSAVRAYERQHILHVLRACNFDKNEAAKALDIGLSSLYRKMDELGIGKPTDGSGEQRAADPPAPVSLEGSAGPGS